MDIRRRPTVCALILLYGFLTVAAALCAFSAAEGGVHHPVRHGHNAPITRHGPLCLWACSLPLQAPVTAWATLLALVVVVSLRPRDLGRLDLPFLLSISSRAPPA